MRVKRKKRPETGAYRAIVRERETKMIISFHPALYACNNPVDIACNKISARCLFRHLEPGSKPHNPDALGYSADIRRKIAKPVFCHLRMSGG